MILRKLTGVVLGSMLTSGAVLASGPQLETGLSAAIYPQDIAVGDLDGDGKPDLVAIGMESQADVLLGQGDGTFIGHPEVVGENPGRVVLADMDNDGIRDMVVLANTWYPGQEEVRVVLGSGSGGFLPPESRALNLASAFDPGTYPSELATGDFDGDGWTDVVVAANPGGLVVLHGLENGTLTAPAHYPAPAVETYGEMDLGVGDLTGDGAIDAVVSLGEYVFLFPGDGQGGFGAASAWDLVPDGNWEEILSLAVEDVNMDAVLDVVVGTDYESATVRTLLAPGMPGFDGTTVDSPVYRAVDPYGMPTAPRDLILADFDGNLIPDAAMVDRYQGNVVVLYGLPGNNQPGRFVNFEIIYPGVSEFPLGEYPEQLIAADLDGDLALDFVSHRNDALLVQLAAHALPPEQAPVGDWVGTEGEALSITITATPQDVEVNGADVYTLPIVHDADAAPLDFNGDAHLDLLDFLPLNYAAAYGAAYPEADVNGDGVVDQADMDEFLMAWESMPAGFSWDPLNNTLTIGPQTEAGTYTVTAFSYQYTRMSRERFTITIEPSAPAGPLTPVAANASSTYSTYYAPGKVLDGQPYTYWIGALDSRPWILNLDLGGEYTLDALEIDWLYLYTSSDFDIEVSSDGDEWTSVASGLNQPGSTVSPYLATTRVDLERGTASHLRVVIHSESYHFPVVSEVRLFGW